MRHREIKDVNNTSRLGTGHRGMQSLPKLAIVVIAFVVLLWIVPELKDIVLEIITTVRGTP